MDLEGSHIIPLPRREVWAALNDPGVLRACIPGCRQLTKIGEDRFAATVASKIGPVSAVFTGEVQLSDIVPHISYRIAGSGTGGIAGFAKGWSDIVLADAGEGTRLSYTATAEIGGKLASVGSRLLQGVARRTADDFFAAFVEQLVPASAAAEAAPGPAPQRPAHPPSPASVTTGNRDPAGRPAALPWVLAAAGWIVAALLAGLLIR